MLYERTAISKKPEKLIEKELQALREDDTLTPDLVFRDPYFLDFLGLRDTYSEKDLEAAILRQMESFLLELGSGFAFVARQKRITLDGDDYYIDLLFYHRRLRRLVMIELKIGDFKPADKGQFSNLLYEFKIFIHQEKFGSLLGGKNVARRRILNSFTFNSSAERFSCSAQRLTKSDVYSNRLGSSTASRKTRRAFRSSVASLYPLTSAMAIDIASPSPTCPA